MIFVTFEDDMDYTISKNNKSEEDNSIKNFSIEDLDVCESCKKSEAYKNKLEDIYHTSEKFICGYFDDSIIKNNINPKITYFYKELEKYNKMEDLLLIIISILSIISIISLVPFSALQNTITFIILISFLIALVIGFMIKSIIINDKNFLYLKIAIYACNNFYKSNKIDNIYLDQCVTDIYNDINYIIILNDLYKDNE